MEQLPETPAEVGTRPQGPRTGRRAASTLVPVANDVEDDLSSAAPKAPLGPKPQVPRRRGGWGGTGVEDTAKPSLQAPVQLPSPLQAPSTASVPLPGMSRRKAAQAAVRDSETLEPAMQSLKAEDADTFMEIPDLEAEEDMSRQVAAAPAVRSVSVMNIAELESADLFRLPVVDKDHEVDLSLLTACLCPADEADVLDTHAKKILSGLYGREPALDLNGQRKGATYQAYQESKAAEDLVVWDYETLLTEVASELHAEGKGFLTAAS